MLCGSPLNPPGPLHDASLIITHNASEPVDAFRPPPPESLALLRRLLAIGRLANHLVEIYPLEKWHGSASSSRRLLTTTEALRLRRAFYRLWLYSLTFHNPAHQRTARLWPWVVRSRATLLRSWDNDSLVEMLDVHKILRSLIAYSICPSNSTVLRRYKLRYPCGRPPALVAVDHSPSALLMTRNRVLSGFHNSNSVASSTYSNARTRHCIDSTWTREEVALFGWGDEISHYYVVEDMLKLSPGHIMWLYDYFTDASSTTPTSVSQGLSIDWRRRNEAYGDRGGTKDKIQGFISGDWFKNNGETFVETMGFVVEKRGGEMGLLKESVEEGEKGVVEGAFW